MQGRNEYILTVAYVKRSRKDWTGIGVNLSRKRFMQFKNKLRLSDPVKFPSYRKDDVDRDLSSNLTMVQKLDKDTYLVGGYEQKGYLAAEVDANTRRVKRPVIPHFGVLHNCAVYQKVVLVAQFDSLFVTGLNTPAEERLEIKDYILNPAAPGAPFMSCGRNMVRDGSKVYMVCKRKDSPEQFCLVRINLGSLDPTNLRDSFDRLNLIKMAVVTNNSSLHVGESNVFVVESRKITRVNKKTLKITVLESPIEGGEDVEGLVAVGTDKHAFVVKRNMMYLLRIENSSVKKVDEVDTQKFSGVCTRMLVPGKFKKVSFVARLMEYSTHLAIYAALKESLFLIADRNIEWYCVNRILGSIYDADRDQLILTLEYDMSVTVRLTY